VLRGIRFRQGYRNVEGRTVHQMVNRIFTALHAMQTNQSINQSEILKVASGMPLLGPLLGIRLLEQKCLKSVTECYQSFGRGDIIPFHTRGPATLNA